jgi:TRAP-type C4-dicarboxylate transport system permease small subunit
VTADRLSEPENEPNPGAVAGVARIIHQMEDAFLALLLGSMIGLASLQIFLRVALDQGLVWADPLLRVLVLWVGMMGAVAASRGDRHISIDALSRFLPAGLRQITNIITSLLTAAVSGLIAYHSGRFVSMEHEFASVSFSGIPSWTLQSVIPIAFAIIALRYAMHAGSRAAALISGEAPSADDEEPDR